MRRITLLFCLLAALCCAFAAQAGDTPLEAMNRAARRLVPTVSVHRAGELHAQGALFLDCRSTEAFLDGHVPGAVHIPRGQLEFRCDYLLPDKAARVVVYSNIGRRSLLAARTLLRMGYAEVLEMDEGFEAWQAADLPLETGE